MTKKEAIVKYITEMNSDMVSLLLDDNKSYMDVPKETFVNKLEEIFQRLKNEENYQFSRVVKGYCNGGCTNGCGGYSFLTIDNQSLDLLFQEEDDEIKDIYVCSLLHNEEQIDNKNTISISFYDDEKTNYIPSSRYLSLQKQIDSVFFEFNKFKNNITDIDTFCIWSLQVNDLYDNINLKERNSLKLTKSLLNLASSNDSIEDLIVYHPLAKKAMNDFKNLDISNEPQIIEWVLKYEKNELAYGNYKKVKNWKKNNLILHSLDNTIIIECSKYAESLYFSEIQTKYYWKIYKKYDFTAEEFSNVKAQIADLKYSLILFLEIKNVHQELSLFKTVKKPIYLEYVIGDMKDSDQFIEIAGKELGINVTTQLIGSINSFIDENGELQLKSYPELDRFDLENKKADLFYKIDIGEDWKLKFKNKIMELFNENKIYEYPC